MTQIITSLNYEETQKIGEKFAEKVKDGGILALHGDLGSGKTTFVQGLAKGLGLTQKIISPTFIVVRKYSLSSLSDPEFNEGELKGQRPPQAKNFYHIDLYRIESEADIKGLGLEEIFEDKTNIVAIEWPEKIKKFLPENTLNLHLEYIKDDKRKIIIK